MKKDLECLKVENSERPCKEFNANAPKTYEKKINQLRSAKAKGLKRGF